MTSINIKSILSNYIKSQKNISIFEKNILKYDESLIRTILYEIIIDIQNQVELKTILAKIKTGDYIWSNDQFNDIKQTIVEHDNFILCPFEVDEGVLECNKCGSKKTFSYSKQTRSGDESTTVFATCVQCKSSWKI